MVPRRAFAAPAPVPLRVIYFPAADVLPLWTGVAKGTYAKYGVAPVLTPTPGSVYQFAHLAAGDFDVALTAIDNVVAYDEGQGPVALPNPDFVAFLGCDNAFLRLYARPEIGSYGDLRGKAIAVDAPTTAFAFVLRRMLESRGLHDGDYTLVPAGGTLERFQKLTTTNEFAATMLTVPFDLQAQAKGFTNLGNAADVIGHYQGIVSAARRGWLSAHEAVAEGYIRGTLDALTWLYDPANRAEAVAVLADNMKITPELAARLYPVLIDRANGLEATGAIDAQGVATVLAIRSALATPRVTLSDPSKYVDDRLYRRARG
jgi:ABC-type nitrate/sulfonate/bicarbonate transport system substrate-binding protein